MSVQSLANLLGGSGGTSGAVTPSGTLTNNAIATGAGGSAVKTPSATSTLDSSGNISTPGSISVGVGGSTAGGIALTQGTAASPAANTILIQAPAAVTAFNRVLQAAVGVTGYVKETVSGTTQTETVVATIPAADVAAGTLATGTILNKRVVTTTDDSTAVIDVAATDIYQLTAVANATTFSTTGSPVDGQAIVIRYKDAGVAKALTWDAIFVAIGVTLPTTTTAGKWGYVGVQYNASATKFHVLAVTTEL